MHLSIVCPTLPSFSLDPDPPCSTGCMFLITSMHRWVWYTPACSGFQNFYGVLIVFSLAGQPSFFLFFRWGGKKERLVTIDNIPCAELITIQ